MVKSKPIIIVVSGVALIVIAWFFFYPSEERQIRKRFKTFAKTASIHAEDTQLIVAGKSKKISKFFAQPCRVEAHEYNISNNYSRKYIHTITFSHLSQYSELNIAFIDLHIAIPEKGVAHAVSTVRIIGQFKGEQEYIEENQEVECGLKKIEDEWFLTKVELIDVLKK